MCPQIVPNRRRGNEESLILSFTTSQAPFGINVACRGRREGLRLAHRGVLRQARGQGRRQESPPGAQTCRKGQSACPWRSIAGEDVLSTALTRVIVAIMSGCFSDDCPAAYCSWTLR